MQRRLRKIFYYLFVISMTLGGPVEITHLDYIPKVSQKVILLIMLSVAVLGIIAERELKISKSTIVVFVAIVIYLLFFVLATWYNVTDYLISFFLVFVVFFIYSYSLIRKNNLETLFNAYENFFVIIALISLFFWLFGSIYNIIPGKIGGTFSINGYSSRSYNYFYLYFENPAQNQQLLGLNIPRNCGPYCEAPAFAGRLLYAFLIEFFQNKAKNKFRFFVLLAALLSTQSTKALILLMVIFTVYFVLRKSSGKKQLLKWGFSIIIISVVIWASYVVLEDKSATYSYAARMQHLKSSFITWLQNPLMGTGYRNVSAIVQNQTQGAGYGGLSMGIVVLLAQGGIFLFAFYFYAIFYGYKNKDVRMNRVQYITCVATLVVNLLISNSAFSFPYILMISICYALGTIGNKEVAVKHKELLKDKQEKNAVRQIPECMSAKSEA